VSEGEEKKKYHLLAEILTPITKSYPTDAGVQSVSNGIQVLGGYGYCEDFPLEQYYRDIRITPLYEGTNGIQSLDLLGRKVTMENGAAFKLLMGEIGQTIAAASAHDALKSYAGKLKAEIDRLVAVTQHLSAIAMKGQVELFLADATVYMEMFGLIAVSWQWLKQATLASEKLADGDLLEEDRRFYEGKIHTMKFFFVYELTKTLGLAATLMAEENLTVLTDEDVLQEQV
jgi:butyryl-CoA dehydrogenase